MRNNLIICGGLISLFFPAIALAEVGFTSAYTDSVDAKGNKVRTYYVECDDGRSYNNLDHFYNQTEANSLCNPTITNGTNGKADVVKNFESKRMKAIKQRSTTLKPKIGAKGDK